jgi:tetratricopeptide (TPR) repeat protein
LLQNLKKQNFKTNNLNLLIKQSLNLTLFYSIFVIIRPILLIQFKKMLKTTQLKQMMDLVGKMSRDPTMVTHGLIGGVQLKNKGNTALSEGKFEKALKFFKEALDLVEPAFGYDTQESLDCLIGMTDCFIGMKQLSIAEEHAKRVMNIAKKFDDKEHIETAQDLLNEIEKVRLIVKCYLI